MIDGKKIRLLREQQGWGVTEFANKVGVSQTLVSLIEIGARNPSVPIFALIANQLGTTMDDLMKKEVS